MAPPSPAAGRLKGTIVIHRRTLMLAFMASSFCFAGFYVWGLMTGLHVQDPKSVSLLFTARNDRDALRLPRNVTLGVFIPDHPWSDTWHNMDDVELLDRAAKVTASLTTLEGGKPKKVAFMFLVRGRIPLADFWERFFRGNEDRFSLYIHSKPGYVYYENATPTAFRRRQIPSKDVQWGKMSMVDAERRLLANALFDPSNARFVLLSETCIPLFNFTFIYDYLMGTNESFLGVYDDPGDVGRGRYKMSMAPTIPIKKWRKGSQWFELTRDLTRVLVNETRYYDVFREFCKRKCYPDEHYFATMVAMLAPEMDNNRGLTYAFFAGGVHPRRFFRHQVTRGLIRRMRRKRNCVRNGELAVCFLFARKFAPCTVQRLLSLSSWMGM